MRVYISGPMTGKKNLNREAFLKAEERLQNNGDVAVNPHRITEALGFTVNNREKNRLAKSFSEMYENSWRNDCFDNEKTRYAQSVMDIDLAAIRSCEAIFMLEGWEFSVGARKEMAEALRCGLSIFFERKGE